MKTINRHHALSVILCLLLIAAVALFTTGCSGSSTPTASTDTNTTAPTVTAAQDGSILGEGDTQFALIVTDRDGNEVHLDIRTDKATVGEALLALGLIAGEEDPNGLYIQTVNGITVDFDKDGVYWAFYVDGEYAMSSVDLTEIVAGTTYALKVES